MTELIVERDFPDGLTIDQLYAMGETNGNCFIMHKIAWHESFLSSNGNQLICWFNGPDAESGRLALKEARSIFKEFWPANLHLGPDHELLQPNVMVLRVFSEPASLDKLQAQEDANISCLDTRNVKFVKTFFSFDKKRMVCLYQAPDAESVRESQRKAHMPFEDVWAFKHIVNDA